MAMHAGIAIANTNEAAQNTQNTQNNSSYPSSFFQQYKPQNAFEMIERLPGFSFDGGSQARGFGGNAGNVLIDAARPTSKSGGLEGALKRIPSDQVVSIEIHRGGAGATEAQGQSIVANVVRSQSGTSGTWATKFRQVGPSAVEGNLEASLSSQISQWNTSFDLDIGGNPSYRTALIEDKDSAEQLTSRSEEVNTEIGRWFIVNGEGSTELGGGQLSLNGRVARDNWRNYMHRDINTSNFTVTDNLDELWQLDELNKLRSAELGADWTKTLDNWKWRLIGLGMVKDVAYNSHTQEQVLATTSSSDSRYQQDYLTTEYIARTTLTQTSGNAYQPEYGIEIAKNKLDTHSQESEDGIMLVDQTSAVVVEEWRGEFFANFNYAANDALTIEGGLTLEFSRIDVSGDTAQQQSFQFIKPRMSATYEIDDYSSINLEAEHRVGQLDFEDFASSNEASDGNSSAGNPNLKPDQTTEMSMTYDWSFSQRGSFKIKTYHQWRSDILEQVILSRDELGGVIDQGLGNAGDGRFWGITTELNLPLDAILANGLIEISHKYRKGIFFDPVIGADRKISNYSPSWLSFKFRQDFVDQQFAWGAEYWGSYTKNEYRVDEHEIFSGNKRLRLFIETSRFFGVKTQLEVSNVNNGHYRRERLLYIDRRGGEFDGSQISRRKRRPELKLSISGTF